MPDLGSWIQKQQQKRKQTKELVVAFFCSHKYHIIENYFAFDLVKKKIWANLQGVFTQKICH
jgi:hypothetical protein